LSSSTEWLAYLRFMAVFAALNNLMLIATQCPHATQVAGSDLATIGAVRPRGRNAIKILG
jgi:hypothetical protein